MLKSLDVPWLRSAGVAHAIHAFISVLLSVWFVSLLDYKHTRLTENYNPFFNFFSLRTYVALVFYAGELLRRASKSFLRLSRSLVHEFAEDIVEQPHALLI